jgi:formate dehydrogenase major subunit
MSASAQNYLAQKLMRAVIGSNNVDNCSRICHAPTAAGLSASLGLAGGTNPLDDFERADCFLLAGANPTEAHPVVGARLRQQALRGASLVVIDTRQVELADYADLHLRCRPGTNVAVFNGLAHVLLEEGYADEEFLTARVNGLAELRAVLADLHGPERVEQISGVPAEDLRRAARIYSGARCASIVYGLGVTEHAHGADGVRALTNLALLTGQVGTEHGGGIVPLRGQNNVQGATRLAARLPSARQRRRRRPCRGRARRLRPRDLAGSLSLPHCGAGGRRAPGGSVLRKRRHFRQLRAPLPARPPGHAPAW